MLPFMLFIFAYKCMQQKRFGFLISCSSYLQNEKYFEYYCCVALTVKDKANLFVHILFKQF